MNRAGEGGDDHPPFGIGDVAIQVGEDRALRRAEARNLGVGGIAEQTEDALVTVVGKASHVEVFAVDRGVVELEVTRENHGSHRCGDGQREAVGHRVGVADELHGEVLTHLHHIARTDGLQGGAVADTGLVHLAGEHREGQPRPVDHRNVEVLEVMGDATDVVFMTMGDDHAADPLLVLAQEAGVGQHHIHPVHAVAGEGQTGIHQHQVIAVLEHTGVLADLVQTTQGNHPKAGLLPLAGSRVVGHEKRCVKERVA